MKPLSDFTTPRRLIVPISRHFFPVEHPEPFCCTTGLKNGSRFPLIAHFLSSGLGSLEAASGLASVLVATLASVLASAAGAGAAGLVSLAAGLAGGFIGSALATTTAAFVTAGLAAGAADFATT